MLHNSPIYSVRTVHYFEWPKLPSAHFFHANRVPRHPYPATFHSSIMLLFRPATLLIFLFVLVSYSLPQDDDHRRRLVHQEQERLCRIFQSYHFTVKLVNKLQEPPVPGQPWKVPCEAFYGLDDQLCPHEDDLGAICSHSKPHSNRAVKVRYCQDLFDEIDEVSNDTSGNDCVQYCVNYVSKSRGDCCDFECN